MSSEYTEMRCLSIEELAAHSKQKPFQHHGRVLVFDYDHTLVSRDDSRFLNGEHEGTESEAYLIGGQETVDRLQTLHQEGVKLCIASHKNKDGAEEAIKQLRQNGIAQYFDFFCYGPKDGDNETKRAMLTVTKASYMNPEAANFAFIDDKLGNVETARELEFKAMYIKTDTMQKTPEQNWQQLEAALDAITQHFACLPVVEPAPSVNSETQATSSTATITNNLRRHSAERLESTAQSARQTAPTVTNRPQAAIPTATQAAQSVAIEQSRPPAQANGAVLTNHEPDQASLHKPKVKTWDELPLAAKIVLGIVIALFFPIALPIFLGVRYAQKKAALAEMTGNKIEPVVRANWQQPSTRDFREKAAVIRVCDLATTPSEERHTALTFS